MKYQKYTEEQRKEALSLFAENNNASQTASKLLIPRHTVRAWVAGGVTRDEDSKIATISPLEFNLEQKKAYSYILGLYLGDGCISKTHKENVFRMRIILDTVYLTLNKYAIKNLQTIFPNNKVTITKVLNQNCVTLSVYSSLLPEVFPHTGLGMKHLRKIELTDWQKEIIIPKNIIQGLFHSDGSYYLTENRYDTFAFTNMSYDIKTIYDTYLNKLGVFCSRNLRAKAIYSYGINAILLKELIGTKNHIKDILDANEKIIENDYIDINSYIKKAKAFIAKKRKNYSHGYS